MVFVPSVYAPSLLRLLKCFFPQISSASFGFGATLGWSETCGPSAPQLPIAPHVLVHSLDLSFGLTMCAKSLSRSQIA